MILPITIIKGIAFSSIQNLEYDTDELIYKAETDSQT